MTRHQVESTRYSKVSSSIGPAWAARRRSDSRSASPERRRSSLVSAAKGSNSMESTSMDTGPTAYRPLSFTLGRRQSRNRRRRRPRSPGQKVPAELHQPIYAACERRLSSRHSCPKQREPLTRRRGQADRRLGAGDDAHATGPAAILENVGRLPTVDRHTEPLYPRQ